MTRDEILAMEAGRELDRLIAQHILGKVRHEKVYINGRWYAHETWLNAGEDPADPWWGTQAGGGLGFYSTNIAAAWVVVEKMLRDGFLYHADCASIGGPGSSIPKQAFLHEWRFFKGPHLWGECDDSLPLAICRAALLAVMEVSC